MVAMDLARKNTAEAESRATELLTQVGLSERLHHRPAQLSGGRKATRLFRTSNSPIARKSSSLMNPLPT